MDSARRQIIIYPSENQIVRINKIQIELKGGLPFVPPFNYRSQATTIPLILDTISKPIFGEEPYIGLCNKASALSWKIIEGHVFNDANKRTGMSAAIAMMKINRQKFYATTNEIVDIAVSIGKSEYSIEMLSAWLLEHCR